MNVNACILLVLIQISLVLSIPHICYFCNTEVHGEGCEEPINADSIQVQNCSTLDIVIASNQYSSKFKQSLVDRNKIQESIDTKITRAYDAACIYMTYNFSGRSVSARGCEIESIDTNIGTLDICEYYRQIIPTRIENFACTTCKSDLCNHQGYGEADNEEPDNEEADNEEPDNEEPDNEGGDNEDDGANVFSDSLNMLMAMLFVSFYI